MKLTLHCIVPFYCLFFSLTLFAHGHPDAALIMSVVKVIAVSDQGRLSVGSGVVVTADKVVTNCHVIRQASSVAILKSGSRYPVISEMIDSELDLCLLSLKQLPLPSVDLGLPSSLKQGDTVYAYGYPNAKGMSYRKGLIKQLHRFQNSLLIEIDINFKQGASGGGLFNADGQLIGLTTFYRNNNGGQYFAIPIAWLETVIRRKSRTITPFSGLPFWRQDLALPINR